MDDLIWAQQLQEKEEEKESGTVQDDSDLKQALRQWQDHLAFLNQLEMDAKKTQEEKEKEKEAAERRRENLLLGLKNKRSCDNDNNENDNDSDCTLLDPSTYHRHEITLPGSPAEPDMEAVEKITRVQKRMRKTEAEEPNLLPLITAVSDVGTQMAEALKSVGESLVQSRRINQDVLTQGVVDTRLTNLEKKVEEEAEEAKKEREEARKGREEMSKALALLLTKVQEG